MYLKKLFTALTGEARHTKSHKSGIVTHRVTFEGWTRGQTPATHPNAQTQIHRLPLHTRHRGRKGGTDSCRRTPRAELQLAHARNHPALARPGTPAPLSMILLFTTVLTGCTQSPHVARPAWQPDVSEHQPSTINEPATGGIDLAKDPEQYLAAFEIQVIVKGGEIASTVQSELKRQLVKIPDVDTVNPAKPNCTLTVVIVPVVTRNGRNGRDVICYAASWAGTAPRGDTTATMINHGVVVGPDEKSLGENITGQFNDLVLARFRAMILEMHKQAAKEQQQNVLEPPAASAAAPDRK